MSTDVAGIAADRLRSFVERVERLESEIADLNTDKAEVYQEAKAQGFDVPALKALISERRKRGKNPAKFEEAVTILDLYRDAVDGGALVATRARMSHEAEGRA
ncbi:DUF2312 domain-containing protein [Azospirillum sp. A1-3]|uniref:DUF2312 domain-containing protein n=1 Tax=Azospirillum sp. A1-3 TaxID=185874 RepID=UPI0020776017|nr:DUF2312 domain-containing protein [Azospirillum sp. A1-3]MCM8734605.1 DUF2312 domain-containing protein [Azospirillum sp. A1-3]